MQKGYRKYALKTSPYHFLILVNSAKLHQISNILINLHNYQQLYDVVAKLVMT